MKSEESRKRSREVSRRLKVDFENRMVRCMKSLNKKGKNLSKYLKELKTDSYGSDNWQELTKLFYNLTRDRTIKDHDKLTHYRFHVWGENIYRGLGVEREKIGKLQSSKKQKQTPETGTLATCTNSGERVPLDVDIWLKRTLFPPNFPKLTSKIGGHTLRILSWRSLLLDAYIDDVVVNGYLQLLCSYAQSKLNVNILPLDVHLVQNVIFHNELGGFIKLMDRVDFKSYQIMLFPMNDGHEHWTLLVAVPDKQLIVYLDSKHGQPESVFVDRICSFFKFTGSLEKESTSTSGRYSPPWILQLNLGKKAQPR
ncbi:hypothetical protein QAD02_012776 [Eretmocerus hayati]|uniref:Uncharacterized protein n=1 Tax=Eretmocerus hayati TaxID=131215 RepID=A0ACC2P0C8_9HYME|nr:hypothetical protein QAD02_012776 [Eretmocerus hayati]